VSAAALLSLLLVAAGLWLSDPDLRRWLVVAGLALHVALDGLDGPVARASGTSSRAGAFTDMCLDHAGFLIVVSLLCAAGWVEGPAACVYLSTYTLSVILVVAQNVLGRSPRFVVRTKYAFYALTALQAFSDGDLLTPAVWLFGGVHGLFAMRGFFAVRRALS
jgi:phosphatidylglycerophosphate synthase